MSKDFELFNNLERSDSLCSPSPQVRLLCALEESNLEKFTEILKNGLRSKRVDVNHSYEDPHNGTLLDIACRSTKCCKFVDILVKNGAVVNKVNTVCKKAPLHSAVECSDLDTVKVLVENKSTDVNILDSFANSPLHLAAKSDKVDVIKVLLSHPGIDINASNRKGQTPLHLAVAQNNKASTELLISRVDIDMDERKDFRGKSGRDVVKTVFPELEMQLPKPGGSNAPNKNLFSCLYRRDTKTFIEQAMHHKSGLNDNDGHYTYLQYACESGLLDVVDVLLDYGADPNGFCPVNCEAPIMIAAHQGYHQILRRLLKNADVSLEPVNNKTVLHSVFSGLYMYDDGLKASDESRDHHKCLEYILKEVPRDKLDINFPDAAGNTVLHYAVKLNDADVIKLLLQEGAYIGQKNLFGEVPLNNMNADILEDYLDDCVQTNGKQFREEDFEIIYNFQFLSPPKKCDPQSNSAMESGKRDVYSVISETEPLLMMSNLPELRRLLQHPVLTSFLNLKWYTMRKYFYVNVVFYVFFWLMLTTYILYIYGPVNTAQLQDNNATESVNVEKREQSVRLLWAATGILCMVLFIREFFQFSVSPWSYVKSPENWLEIGLIFMTTMILTRHASVDWQPQCAAVAILASWMELVLLIGRHPLLSTNVEMFKTVTLNFLKFLAWYSILILAFAFSFYILFKDRNPGDEENARFFRDPGMSIFKSVIMLTGEFDAGSIPFGSKLSTSHILFVLFVFLIAIVLFNLLNGLAVSDTQAIRSDAELVGIVSRARLISYVESMAVGDPFPFLNMFDKLTCLCCCVPMKRSTAKREKHIQMFYKRINLFPHTLSDPKVRVLPNQGNLIVFNSRVKRQEDDAAYCGKLCIWNIDPDIIKASKELIARKTHASHTVCKDEDLLRVYSEKMDEYRDKLEMVENASKRNEKMLKEIMYILKERL